MSRKTYIDVLSQIGAKRCAYVGREWASRQCDCKFHRGGKLREHGEESTGCPEIRYLVRFLQSMDDETFNELFGWPGPPKPEPPPQDAESMYGRELDTNVE